MVQSVEKDVFAGSSFDFGPFIHRFIHTKCGFMPEGGVIQIPREAQSAGAAEDPMRPSDRGFLGRLLGTGGVSLIISRESERTRAGGESQSPQNDRRQFGEDFSLEWTCGKGIGGISWRNRHVVSAGSRIEGSHSPQAGGSASGAGRCWRRPDSHP